MVHDNSTMPSLRSINRVIFRIIVILFYFFIFFPFLKLVPLPTDIQPYALLLAIFFFLHFGIIKKSFEKMPFEIMLLFVTFLFSLYLFLISNRSFTSLRSLANYTSLFFISYSTYYILKAQKGFPNKFLKMSIYIWFTVGFIQTFIYRNFLVSLIGRGFSDPELIQARGVVALAPEPTFYGITCVFLLLLTNLHFEKAKQKIFFSILILVQLIFFSQSSIIVLLILLINFELIQLGNVRMYQIAMQIIDDPSRLLSDLSMNERFFHLYFPLLGFFQNWLMPHGFDSWSGYLSDVLSTVEYFVFISERNRIMSGYGAAFFELGFIAFLIPTSITLSIHRFYRNDFKKFLLISLFLNTIMLSAIQLALPVIGFLVGYLCYYGKNLLHGGQKC